MVPEEKLPQDDWAALDAFMNLPAPVADGDGVRDAARSAVELNTWIKDVLKPPPSSQHVEGPRSDHLLWDDAASGSTALHDLLTKGEPYPGWGALMQDVFHTFFKPNPTLRDLSEVVSDHQNTRPFVEQVLEDPATAQTRTVTMLDEVTSAIAALGAGRELLERVEENAQLQQQLQQAPPAGGPPGGPGAAPGAGSPPPGQVPPHSGPPPSAALTKAVHQALRKASQDAQDAQEALDGWGFGDGELQRVPLGERVDLAKKLMTPRFRHLARLIGRLRGLARTRQAGTIRQHRDEIHSLTLGDDLSHVLPSELVNLRHPVRRLDFFRKMLDHQLLQYEVRPVPKRERGPLIVCTDTSGSMNGAPIQWAGAVGLALLDTARRQRRAFAGCYFDTRVLKEFAFARNHFDPVAMIDYATTEAVGGGTAFEPPLQWALQRQLEQDFRDGDIVFITDGQAAVSDTFLAEFQAMKQARGVRVFGIVIGDQPGQMTDWADHVWSIAAITDEVAGELFADVV